MILFNCWSQALKRFSNCRNFIKTTVSKKSFFSLFKTENKSCYKIVLYISLAWFSLPRWVLRGQTDQALAPQTAAFHGLGSGHGEETSHRVRATTVATHHPEEEDGPSGEPTVRCFTDEGELHLHALHFTYCLHSYDRRDTADHHNQPDLASGGNVLWGPAEWSFLCFTNEGSSEAETALY